MLEAQAVVKHLMESIISHFLPIFTFKRFNLGIRLKLLPNRVLAQINVRDTLILLQELTENKEVFRIKTALA